MSGLYLFNLMWWLWGNCHGNGWIPWIAWCSTGWESKEVGYGLGLQVCIGYATSVFSCTYMGWSPMHISVAILGLQCLVALFFIPYMDEGIAYCMCFFILEWWTTWLWWVMRCYVIRSPFMCWSEHVNNKCGHVSISLFGLSVQFGFGLALICYVKWLSMYYAYWSLSYLCIWYARGYP